MKNYILGYARVSTKAQNLDRQLDALKEYGADIIYNEKMTGTRKDRPELAKLIDRMTEGDTVVIESLSRLGRSTKDLIELTELFQKKGVHLVSLKENIDTGTPAGKQNVVVPKKLCYTIFKRYPYPFLILVCQIGFGRRI